MKSIIARRIIILTSIAIIITSILISVLGIILSENVVAGIRGQQYLSDLTMLSRITEQFMEGAITEEVYEAVIYDDLKEDTDVHGYLVFDQDAFEIYRTNNFNKVVDASLIELVEDVLLGEDVVYKTYDEGGYPIELIGVPVMEDDQVIGAAFVVAELADLSVVRMDFIRSLIISIIIVIVFVIILSNFGLRRIIKPVRNVVKVALSMVEGDFNIRADENLQGEIGFVGRSLNKMSVELYKNVSQLYIEKNRLNHVLNSIEEGMMAIDEYMIITHCNAVLEKMFQFDSEEIKGLNLNQVPQMLEEMDGVYSVLEGNGSINKKVEYQERILRISIEPIENESQDIVGVVGLFRDITDMENLETMRKNYVANVSHELRSPLTSIRGLIEPLMDSIVKDEEDIKRYYTIIYEESLRLSRLVDDIMELSRLQTSDIVIKKSKVHINDIMEMVYERYRRLDESVELIYQPVELPTALTNYDRIEQIMVIFLDNAFKFSKKGGKITIKTELRDRDILVSVEDTGVGIAKEFVPFIFDRFFKSDLSRTKKGTGLGLSIAKEIMDLMEEEIYCESEEGQGSCFYFTVKIA